MTAEDLDGLAAEYVIGTLSAEERGEVERRLAGDSTLAAAVAAWEQRLLPLADLLPGEAPPESVWAAIAARTANPDDLLPGTRTVRAIDGRWIALGNGVDVKVLHVDRERKQRSLLLRLAPGGRFPAHPHSGDEECMVLDGEMVIGGVTFLRGDYHIAPRGVDHGEISSKRGGLVFVRGPLDEHPV